MGGRKRSKTRRRKRKRKLKRRRKRRSGRKAGKYVGRRNRKKGLDISLVRVKGEPSTSKQVKINSRLSI